MFDTIKLIGEKFRLSGELYSYSVITVGNINSTYKVTYAVGDNKYKAYLFSGSIRMYLKIRYRS